MRWHSWWRRKRGVVIKWIGGNCPVQAYGRIDGQPFYFRARNQNWEIEIGGGFVLAGDGHPETGFYFEEDYGDGPYDAGWMSVAEARAFIEKAATLFRAREKPS